MSKYTYKDIIEKAKACKNSVKKEQKLGINEKWSYYLAKSVLNPGKDITKISVTDAVAPVGTVIDTKIYEKDFKDMCKRFTKFVENDKNHRLPNYVSYKGYKVTPKLFTEILSRIFVWYDSNKKMPNYASANSKVFSKSSSAAKKVTNGLKPYLKNKGCSGMGQCTSYYCGCNSFQQAFYRLTGILVDEATIAKVAGTTTSGTDHNGLNTVVAWFNKKYKKNVKITWKNFSDLGKTDAERWKKLQHYINIGAVFIHLLYRKKWGHYEVPESVNDANLTILNSLGDKCSSSSYCGYIEYRTKAEQLSYIKGISQKSIAILTI